MIVWSGRGILSVVFLIAMLLLGVAVFPDKQGDYGIVIALFATAAFSWFFGDKWNNQAPRIVVDERTGQRVNLKSVHTLFWIKMQYWGIIFSVMGLIILAQNSILASVISVIVVAAIAFFIYSKKNGESEISPAVVEHATIRPTSNTEPVSQIETPEERMRRRQEKEDPSRFMPK